jgi:hypothetical protein
MNRAALEIGALIWINVLQEVVPDEKSRSLLKS